MQLAATSPWEVLRSILIRCHVSKAPTEDGHPDVCRFAKSTSKLYFLKVSCQVNFTVKYLRASM